MTKPRGKQNDSSKFTPTKKGTPTKTAKTSTPSKQPKLKTTQRKPKPKIVIQSDTTEEGSQSETESVSLFNGGPQKFTCPGLVPAIRNSPFDSQYGNVAERDSEISQQVLPHLTSNRRKRLIQPEPVVFAGLACSSNRSTPNKKTPSKGIRERTLTDTQSGTESVDNDR